MAKAPEQTAPAVDSSPASAPTPEAEKPVKVMLLCDHIYLPEDPTTADWAASTETKRYEGKDGKARARIEVHPTLAAFLQEREQAEIL
jgi:hypothetical protein